MIDFSVRNGLEHVICSNNHLIRPQPSLFDDGHNVSKCTIIGKGDSHSILLCGKRQSYFPFHCIVGPDWPVVVMVYVLILAANLIVLPIVAPLGLPVVIIGVTGFLSLLYCYSAVACSDPGIIYEETLVVDQSENASTIVLGTSVAAPQQSTNVGDSGGGEADRNVESLFSKEANTVEEADTEDALVVQGTVINNNNIDIETGAGKNNKVGNGAVGSTNSQRSRQLAYSERIECGQCELQRPYTARHCHYCGVCIDELDHHCPCKSPYFCT